MIRSKRPSFKFVRNGDGYPTAFWNRKTDTNDLFLLAACAIVRLRICERGRPFAGNVSVITVVFFWCWWLAVHDGRDLLTGFKMDLSLQARGSLNPTLLAHTEHGGSIDLGFTTPFPDSMRQFNASRVTARLELRRINFMIGSRRFPSLLCALRDFSEF